MRHFWQQVTLVQKPPRYRCATCGATKRWSREHEAWTYYRVGVGFVGRRAPKCEPTQVRSEEGATKR